jgi:hypothetical protein
MKILIDNSVLHFAIVFKGQWQSKTIEDWDGALGALIETGGIRSVLQSSPIKKLSPQGGYIAALAKKILSGEMEAYTSDALSYEKWYQKPYKYRGVSYGDISLLSKITPKHIRTLEGFTFSLPADSIADKLRAYINQSQEVDFLAIKNVLPCKSSQDAWHLYCVKKQNLDVFLTMDAALIGQIKSIADRSVRDNLIKIIRTPEELCTDLDISALSNDEITSFARNELGADSFLPPIPIVRKPTMLDKIRDFLKELVHKKT